MQENFYHIINPIIDSIIPKLCKRPYYLHKNGCINYSRKKGCPPGVSLINRIIDLNEIVYIIYNKFDFKGHVERIRKKHPDWTKRQLECCLYWKGSARKKLKEKIRKFKEKFPQLFIINTPEARGVNLTETMKQIDINLEWPPLTYSPS